MSTPYIPAPTPPKTTSLSMMFESGTNPPNAGVGIVHRIYCAAGRIRGYGRKQSTIRKSKSNFLPFHIAAGLRCTRALICTG